MPDTRAIPAYTGSSVTIEHSGTYIGGGAAGWSFGTSFVLCLTERSYNIVRKWFDATCDQYQQGRSGSIKADVDLEGFFRNNGDPPANLITDEFIKVVLAIGGKTMTGIFHNSEFRAVGSITQGSSRYIFRGTSDGPVTIA